MQWQFTYSVLVFLDRKQEGYPCQSKTKYILNFSCIYNQNGVREMRGVVREFSHIGTSAKITV